MRLHLSKLLTISTVISILLYMKMAGCPIENSTLLESKSLFKDGIPSVPFVYNEEVDVRFIVLTYNRPDSLSRCLMHLQSVELDGHSGIIDIWIDRRHGIIDNDTLRVAQEFQWKQGQTRVHAWPCHVGIYGQWIDTWRPREHSKEMAIFLEDDVDISPFAFRWLHAARKAYAHHDDIASFTLNEIVLISSGPEKKHVLQMINNDTVFKSPVTGTWGMAPVPAIWKQFQDWFHRITSTNRTYKPYVPEAELQTGWYRAFVKQKREDTMWSLWFTHFCYLKKFYVIRPNFIAFQKKSFAQNRKAPGLHYHKKLEVNTDKNMLKSWKSEFASFPIHPVIYQFNGSILK